jgi:hypothetical protein
MDAEFGALSIRELGRFLTTGRANIDAAEARWLAALAEFDARGGYGADGHRDCVSWLIDTCGLALSTAKERLRVARELQRRPVLAAALASGKISYTAVKTLTRITGLPAEADEAFVAVAVAGTHRDLQTLYRRWQLLNEQDKPLPDDRWDRCGIQTVARNRGVAVTEVRLPDEDEQRFLRILDLAVDTLRPTPGEAPKGANAVGDGEAPKGANPTGDNEAPLGANSTVGLGCPSWTQRRVDALLTLMEAGLAWLGAEHGVDGDRALVHVLSDYDVLVERARGTAQLDGGYPIGGETARRLACDAGLVRIITRGASEVLDVGRQSREWNTPQRRAIRYRWGGRCAFPGCGHRITQVHHCNPWHPGGETNLDCGVPLCRFHHDLVHEGKWTVAYDPNQRAAIFTSPDKVIITAPTPGTLTWAA